MSELSIGQLKGLAVNSNTVSVPSGHTLYAPGHVIQVVTLDHTTTSSQGFASNTGVDIPGMSLQITPKSATSKILIQARWFGEFTDAGRVYNTVFYITRNGSKINTQTSQTWSGLTMAALSYDGSDAGSTPETANMFTTDFPATTSTITYKVAILSDAAGTLYTNRTVAGTVAGAYELGTSGMIIMEIAQ